MKNFIRLLFVVVLTFTTARPSLAQWVQTNGPVYVSCFAVSDTYLFAGTGGGVFLSTNNGSSWTEVNTGLTNTSVTSLAVSGTNLFTGTWGGGVFLSTNNGSNWTAVNTGLTNSIVTTLFVSGTNLFAGTWDGGVFLSTNNGTSWTEVNTGLPNVNTLAASGTYLFAGTFGFGIYLSTNNGTNWSAANTGLTTNTVYALITSGANLFAGAPVGGIYLSTNNGTNWSAVSAGFPSIDVNALCVSDTYLFAGTSEGVWRRPLSEMITSVELLSDHQPSVFRLEQNYPNPFNPSTTIVFSLPSRSLVTLRVFDILGKEVASLISEELAAGTYTQQWEASGLPSGTYFYRLQAGLFSETRKMILLR